MLLYSLCVFLVVAFSYQCAQTATACVCSLHKTSANKVTASSVRASVYHKICWIVSQNLKQDKINFGKQASLCWALWGVSGWNPGPISQHDVRPCLSRFQCWCLAWQGSYICVNVLAMNHRSLCVWRYLSVSLQHVGGRGGGSSW